MKYMSFRLQWSRLPRFARRILVAITGSVMLVAGLAMLVLPGPGIPVLVGALVVLAAEFTWAEVWLHRVRSQAQRATNSIKRKSKGTSQSSLTGDESSQ